MRKSLIIFGLEDFAEIAYEYFTNDSEYEVIGFTVNKKYQHTESKFNLPVWSFEEIETKINPKQTFFYGAITYRKLNGFRSEILSQAKKKGFTPASYISSNAFVWHNVEIGEHVFIFENNTIQPFVRIGNNTILWSGNHIGHHSSIGNHVFISSHVTVSGWVNINDNCFLGINCSISNGVNIGPGSWINSHTLIKSDISGGNFVSTSEGTRRVLDVNRLEENLEGLSRKRKLED